jgi:uncharacterized protein YkwD
MPRYATLLMMRARLAFLSVASVTVMVAAGFGCMSSIGELGEPEGVVSDEPAFYEEDAGPGGDANIGADTSINIADTGSAAADSSGGDTGPSTIDSGTVVTDTGTEVVDTGTAVVDTGTVVADTGTTGWPAAYATLEQQVLEETNKRRAAGANCGTKGSFGPAPALVMQSQLQAAARKHSKDMAENNYFSHTNLAGQSPFDRMRAEGYTGTTMGENIAAGNATALQTVTQWMNSDGHCAKIMNRSFTQLGVGYWYNASSRYRHYWTQNFGAGGASL